MYIVHTYIPKDGAGLIIVEAPFTQCSNVSFETTSSAQILSGMSWLEEWCMFPSAMMFPLGSWRGNTHQRLHLVHAAPETG